MAKIYTNAEPWASNQFYFEKERTRVARRLYQCVKPGKSTTAPTGTSRVDAGGVIWDYIGQIDYTRKRDIPVGEDVEEYDAWKGGTWTDPQEQEYQERRELLRWTYQKRWRYGLAEDWEGRNKAISPEESYSRYLSEKERIKTETSYDQKIAARIQPDDYSPSVPNHPDDSIDEKSL